MLMFTGLILLCLLGIRLGFSYHYISLAHQLIHYFEEKKSALVFLTADLLIFLAGFIIGGIAYTIDSLLAFLPAPYPGWNIQPFLFIGALVIAGLIELYRFYIKRASLSTLSFILLMIIGCCLAMWVAEGKLSVSRGVFGLGCGLAFSTGALFSETMLKIISYENSQQNTLYYMILAERRTSVLIGYMYLGLAIIEFGFRL